MLGPYPIRAVCEVGGEGKHWDAAAPPLCQCYGTVWFEQLEPDNCIITYDIKGLDAGLHGFHLHETADFSNGCQSAGPHYNPFGLQHGAPEDEARHVGSLGNIEPGEDGVARGEIVDRLVKLEGDTSVLGRSIMIYADADDLGLGDNSASKVTGNAGARIACGEIKLAAATMAGAVIQPVQQAVRTIITPIGTPVVPAAAPIGTVRYISAPVARTQSGVYGAPVTYAASGVYGAASAQSVYTISPERFQRILAGERLSAEEIAAISVGSSAVAPGSAVVESASVTVDTPRSKKSSSKKSSKKKLSSKKKQNSSCC